MPQQGLRLVEATFKMRFTTAAADCNETIMVLLLSGWREGQVGCRREILSY